jgi:hypothetical protein
MVRLLGELACGPQTGFWEIRIDDGYSKIIWEDNGGRQPLTSISALTFQTHGMGCLVWSTRVMGFPRVHPGCCEPYSGPVTA